MSWLTLHPVNTTEAHMAHDWPQVPPYAGSRRGTERARWPAGLPHLPQPPMPSMPSMPARSAA